MSVIITVTDLPAAIQSADMVDAMVAGANAAASRVAPCLNDPTTTAWAATTAYALAAQVKLSGGAFLEVTVAGTSGGTEPAAPARLDATVTDGTVTWKLIAPSADQLAEARLTLLGAVKRWAEAGAGAFQQQSAGPFGITVDTRQRTGYNLWPSEIERLQDICADGGGKKAFSVDTAPPLTGMHVDWCSLNLGAFYCSCGLDIAGQPIYELGC